MKRHLLLIDNDKSQLSKFMEAVRHVDEDFKCTYAETTQQAIEMLNYLKPDFIFVDHSLPTVNCLQLVSVIRDNQSLQDSKIFIYTDTISEELAKMGRLLGADGCIEKNAPLSWLTHIFKAIFDDQLMPSYSILKDPWPPQKVSAFDK